MSVTEMTVAQVAEKLRVSRWSVRRLIKNRDLHAETRGRLIVIPVSSYCDFLRRNTFPATRTPLGAPE